MGLEMLSVKKTLLGKEAVVTEGENKHKMQL